MLNSRGFCSLIWVLATSLFSHLSLLGQEQKWELQKNEDGIQVYTKAMPQSDLDAFEARAVLKISRARIVACLKDADNFCEWMPKCAQAELLKLEGEEQIHYLESEAPFPMDNRDCFYRYRYSEEPQKTTVAIEGLPDYRAPQPDKVRIPFLRGSWVLESIDAQKTRLSYQIQAHPGGSIPAWLANAAAVDLPFETIQNLKEYLKS